MPSLQNGNTEDIKLVQLLVWILILIGALMVALYATAAAIHAPTMSDGAHAAFLDLAAGLSSGGAAFVTGGFLGFLYGIPKTRSGSAPATGADTGFASYAPSTNLEQVADWLTKILVGAGLAELQSLRSTLGATATFLAAAFSDAKVLQSASFVGALLVYGVVAGFLSGYLLTELWLTGAFFRRDKELFTTANKGLAPPTADGGPAVSPSAPASAGGGAAGAPAQPAPAAAGIQKAIDEVIKVPLSQLQTPDQMLIWARAQASKERYDDAEQAYRAALAVRPNDPGLLQEHAAVLSRLGKRGEALDQLARANVQAITDPTLQRRAVEDLMYNSLYEPAPMGYTKVLNLAAEYGSKSVFQRSATYWLYLAAAWGQQYAYELEHNNRTDTAARDQAYLAAKNAIQLQPSIKRTLQSLWNGTDEDDDDLAAFRDDEGFKALLGDPRAG